MRQGIDDCISTSLKREGVDRTDTIYIIIKEKRLPITLNSEDKATF